MHAVGSEIWRCSGILCEGVSFVRGSRSCLRTALRREVNVLLKLVYKAACVFFMQSVRYRKDRYKVSGTTSACALGRQRNVVRMVPPSSTRSDERTTRRDHWNVSVREPPIICRDKSVKLTVRVGERMLKRNFSE